MRLALDWDGTLADPDSHELTGDGAQAVRELLAAGHEVIVHSCRANWPDGAASLRRQLAAAGIFSAEVWTSAGKPAADLYVDDRAVHFAGDWQPILRHIHAAGPAPATMPPSRSYSQRARIGNLPARTWR